MAKKKPSKAKATLDEFEQKREAYRKEAEKLREQFRAKLDKLHAWHTKKRRELADKYFGVQTTSKVLADAEVATDPATTTDGGGA